MVKYLDQSEGFFLMEKHIETINHIYMNYTGALWHGRYYSVLVRFVVW
jgi:hypothetical protein